MAILDASLMRESHVPPEDTYLLEVVRATLGPPKREPRAMMVTIEFQIAEGVFCGWDVKVFFMLQHPRHSVMELGRTRFREFYQAAIGAEPRDTAELEGSYVLAKLTNVNSEQFGLQLSPSGYGEAPADRVERARAAVMPVEDPVAPVRDAIDAAAEEAKASEAIQRARERSRLRTSMPAAPPDGAKTPADADRDLANEDTPPSAAPAA